MAASHASARTKVPSFGWNSTWARLPSTIQPGYTHGVVCDRRGHIHIFNQSPHAVLEFDPQGGLVRHWGQEFARGAHGLFLGLEHGQEFLLLVDYEIPAVVKTTLDGEVLLRLPSPPRPDIYPGGQGYRPTGACSGPNGDMYVCDGYGKPWVHHYGADGRYLQSWGGPGNEPGKFNCPHGIIVDTRSGTPEVLVADRGNVRLQAFTTEGKHLRTITHPALRAPCGFHIAGETMYIPDLHGVLTVWSGQDRLVTEVGDHPWFRDHPSGPGMPGYPNIPKADRLPGQFISPHAVTSDGSGDLVMVEWIEDGRITRLTATSST